jgi:endoglucanase
MRGDRRSSASLFRHQPAMAKPALLWIKQPGESDGKCGGEVSYFFSPRQARELLDNSPNVPPDMRRAAQSAAAPPASTSPMG